MPRFSEWDEMRAIRGVPERPRVPECAVDHLAEECAAEAAEEQPKVRVGILSRAGLALRSLFVGLMRQRRAER